MIILSRTFYNKRLEVACVNAARSLPVSPEKVLEAFNDPIRKQLKMKTIEFIKWKITNGLM